MRQHKWSALGATIFAALSPVTIMGQSPAVEAPVAQKAFDRRAAELVDLFAGKIAYSDYFDSHFQSAVSEPQFDTFRASLIAQYGKPLAIDRTAVTADRSGTVSLHLERGIATVLLDVGAGPDARVTGLRVTGVTVA